LWCNSFIREVIENLDQILGSLSAGVCDHASEIVWALEIPTQFQKRGCESQLDCSFADGFQVFLNAVGA
jgi:hypothetical protein